MFLFLGAASIPFTAKRFSDIC
jgi:hypothetical protein